ncbi:rho guanine nucleotide exchange factor 11-like [Cyanocitta cristata]
MSVRPPQALDSEGPPAHTRQPSDASESTGLVQRCVVIQRDQHGFGFTVSGDRVVLVQSVRPGGAAMKAGVQEGDRIVKVNGTMVTNSSHVEVVKLIKSGAYVALTLLGSPPGISGSQQDPEPSGCPQGTPPAPPPPQRITEPRPLQGIPEPSQAVPGVIPASGIAGSRGAEARGADPAEHAAPGGGRAPALPGAPEPESGSGRGGAAGRGPAQSEPAPAENPAGIPGIRGIWEFWDPSCPS